MGDYPRLLNWTQQKDPQDPRRGEREEDGSQRSCNDKRGDQLREPRAEPCGQLQGAYKGRKHADLQHLSFNPVVLYFSHFRNSKEIAIQLVQFF